MLYLCGGSFTLRVSVCVVLFILPTLHIHSHTTTSFLIMIDEVKVSYFFCDTLTKTALVSTAHTNQIGIYGMKKTVATMCSIMIHGGRGGHGASNKPHCRNIVHANFGFLESKNRFFPITTNRSQRKQYRH